MQQSPDEKTSGASASASSSPEADATQRYMHPGFAPMDGEGRLPAPPIGQMLGFQGRVIKPGESLVEMRVDGRYANPMGTLHGGILCDLADYAMGIAYASVLGPGETFTTLEMKINYFRPVWEAQLRAIGRVVSRGRTVGMAESDIYDEKDRLIARVSSTCMTLRGEMASGR